MTTQEFFNRYGYHFSPNKVGAIMTQEQWKRCRESGFADYVKELAAEIATWERCASEKEVQDVVDSILERLPK